MKASRPSSSTRSTTSAADVLTQNENDNWMRFSVDERGFLQACTYTPMACQDDCSRGPTIDTLVF